MNMYQKIVGTIKDLLNPVTQDELEAYAAKLPKTISVKVEEWENGYVAFIDSIDGEKISGLATQTNLHDINELIESVNDVVFTYLDIPERIRKHSERVIPQGLLKEEVKFARG